MAPQETIQAVLAGRVLVYKLIQSVLGNEPSAELIEAAGDEAVREACRMFVPANRVFAKACDAWLREIDAAKGAGLEMLKKAYTKLFIGPHEMRVAPWESVYVNEERLIFQESTLDVRRAYVAWGFIPGEYPHVADDHVSLEADFMARLGSKAAKAYDEGDVESAKSALDASREFLEEHLLKWVAAYAETMRKEAPEARLYQAAVDLLESFTQIDEGVLKEIRDTL